jgi:hypothetical protein
VPEGEWAAQAAASWRRAGAAGRLTLPVDLRYGLARGVEVGVGTTGFSRGQLGGAVTDPRALRVSLLTRLVRQEDWRPSLSTRFTLEQPIAGPADSPAWRGDLLASWAVADRTWVHGNGSYKVQAEEQAGVLAAERRTWWQLRGGVVHQLAVAPIVAGRPWGVVADVGVQQDPATVARRVAGDLEGALIAPLDAAWTVSASVGYLTGVVPTMRLQVGVQWVF